MSNFIGQLLRSFAYGRLEGDGTDGSIAGRFLPLGLLECRGVQALRSFGLTAGLIGQVALALVDRGRKRACRVNFTGFCCSLGLQHEEARLKRLDRQAGWVF